MRWLRSVAEERRQNQEANQTDSEQWQRACVTKESRHDFDAESSAAMPSSFTQKPAHTAIAHVCPAQCKEAEDEDSDANKEWKR